MATIRNNPIPAQLLSDHLFLTVGQNPLPNYVSALLLTSNCNPVVYLLHTAGDDKSNTKPFAERLKSILEREKRGLKAELCELKESDSIEIATRVQETISKFDITGRTGFNYTGGTKPMNIHTYLKLTDNFSSATYSYLDARELAMYIEGQKPIPIGRAVDIGLTELAELHGYDLNLSTSQKQPQHLLLAKTIAEVHLTKQGDREWREWLGVTNWHPPEEEDFTLWQQWLEKRKKRLTELPDPEHYPALRKVRQAMDAMCGDNATPETVAEILLDKPARLDQAAKWLNSTWLEELVLDAIIQNADTFDIKYYGKNVEPIPNHSVKERRNFELDVAATIGYQLFVFSCIVSQKEGGETKRHLMEAYTRARQLGGDEARIALVSCVKNPRVLEYEIKRDWHASDQIKVFGQKDLVKLPQEIGRWFKSQTPKL